ncbi:hypothetical protein OH805_21225 [Streptomyces sp. NBC_00879]|uniref:hypothetical protein n=1 Tax=Streptomyces sp. NBC_00879 TaxID=2975855 RepID=UPI00386B2F95|nr:hypothetical protein OH805_21225 [Streptomyces sp. NBC_00879]
MAKSTYERTVRDAKRAGCELKKGDRFFIVMSVDTTVAPYEDDRLYSEYTVTGDHPLLGGAMVGGQSVEGICLRFGPLHTEQPSGLRNVATPGPQVAGPLPKGKEFDRKLTEREIADLERQVERADYASGRGKRGWF